MPLLQHPSAISDAVLTAARAAMPRHPGEWLPADHQRNQPVVALLVALLDATQATVNAVADNCRDACQPIPRDLAEELAKQARAIADSILNAADAPNREPWSVPPGWSLPSMTGRDLV
jgi:hypothetical protein